MFVHFSQTFRSLSLTASPSTGTGLASMVKVQVRVDEHDSSQLSRLAMLAGVSPPMTEADLLSAEQREHQSRQHREQRDFARRDSITRLDLASKFKSTFANILQIPHRDPSSSRTTQCTHLFPKFYGHHLNVL